MTDIGDFILARVEEEKIFRKEIYDRVPDLYYPLLDFAAEVVEFHKNWPVLVEGELEHHNLMVDNTVHETITYQLSRKIAWATEQEYIKHFGSDPLPAPLIRKLANIWSDHDDFNLGWAF